MTKFELNAFYRLNFSMLLKVEVQVTNKNRNCCQRIIEHMYHHTILQISPSIISNIEGASH